jgi:hypothetical protein
MRYTVLTLLPLALALTACGNDSGAPAPTQSAAPAAATTPAAPAATPTEPAAASEPTPQVAAESTAAPVTDEVVYDPIDVSKLQSSWWQQYNSGG